MKTNETIETYRSLRKEIAETSHKLEELKRTFDCIDKTVFDYRKFSLEGLFFKRGDNYAVCVGQYERDARILVISEGFGGDGEWKRCLYLCGMDVEKLINGSEPCTPEEFISAYRSVIKEFDVSLNHAIELYEEEGTAEKEEKRKPRKRALVDPSSVSINPKTNQNL